MFRFKNAVCPYCNKEFTESDDIVVCPECGTPHHRDCYKANGKCANEALHSEGYQWAAPSINADNSEKDTIVCPNCGKENIAGGKFCNYCGTTLEKVKEPVLFGFQVPSINEEEEIDGHKIKHIKRYIGSSWEFYIYQFLIQNRLGRKISFTWSAMLFPLMYFLYRKLWVMAAVAFAVSTISAIPLIGIQLAEMGYALAGQSANLWYAISPYASGLSTVFSIFCALFSAWIYRKTIIKKLSALKAKSASEQELLALIDAEAGPSKKAVLIGILGVALVSFVIAYIIANAVI